MLAVLIQLDGYDPVAEANVTLRAASINDSAVCHLDGQTWWPTLKKLPTLAYDLSGAGEGGKIDTPTSTLSLATEPWPLFGRFMLADARIRLWTGEAGAAWGGYTLRFDGRVKQQPKLAAGIATVEFGVDDGWLDLPLLATYAGTGGVEGPAALKGVAKPLALGRPRYAPGVLIDSVNNVWQLSGHGAIEDVEAALERLGRFPASSGDYANYAALVAAAIPAGHWATCRAAGLVRHGAPAAGTMSWLLRGDKTGGATAARLPGALMTRIAALAGRAGAVDGVAMAALDVARPHHCSRYVGDQTTARDLLSSLASGVNAAFGISWLGKLFAVPVGLAASTMTLAANGTSLPIVAGVERLETGAPYTRIAMTAERTWQVHELADVAFTAMLIDLGAWQAGTTYREGNIVSLIDGSRWIYVNVTPTAGNRPSSGSVFWQQYDASSRLQVVPDAAWDDSVDDGPALLDAIEEANFRGGYVFIPEGRTLWTDGIILPPRATIVGGNRFTSKIKLRSTAAYNTRMLDGRAVLANESYSLRSLTLDGSQSDDLYESVALEIWDAKVDLQDLEITGGAIEGIYLYRCHDFTASSLHCYGNGEPGVDASGLHISQCDGFSVTGLNSHDNGFHGLILTEASNGTIEGVVGGNAIDGVRAQYGTKNVHLNIVSRANGLRAAYFTTGSNNCTVAGVLADCTNGLATNEATNIVCSARSSGHAEWDVYLVAAGDSVTWTGSPSFPLVANDGPGTITLAGDSAVTVTLPALSEIAFSSDGSTAITNELPRYVTAAVTAGGSGITGSANVSYAATFTNLTGSIDDTNGSPTKGTIEITAISANEGYVDVVVTVNGVAQPSKRVVAKKVLAPANAAGGAGSKFATDSSLTAINVTAYTQVSDTMTVTLATGERLVSSGSIDLWVDGSGGVGRTGTFQIGYRLVGGGAFTFGADLASSLAYSGRYTNRDGFDEWIEATPGNVLLNQAVTGLAAGDYEVAVFAKLSATGRFVSFDGTARVDAKV